MPDSSGVGDIASVSSAERDTLIKVRFDSVAPTYDATLAIRPYVAAPRLLSAVFEFLPDRPVDILDACCGTGSCAPALRPIARSLGGVDLSIGMLTEAAGKHLYDWLECASLEKWLAHSELNFDLIFMNSALMYFDDIPALFSLLARHLATNGLFAFTADTSVGQKGETLIRQLSFDDVLQSAPSAGLEIVTLDAEIERLAWDAAATPVPGMIGILRKAHMP